jgi:hypothetical protein
MQCQATIKFGDDYADNETTFHCGLEKGHDGDHEGAMFAMHKQPYKLVWHEEVE